MLGASMLASTAIGAAKGALEAYLEMTTGRKTRGALAGGGLRTGQVIGRSTRLADAPADELLHDEALLATYLG